MAGTSSTDAYDAFKQAGASDRVAGLGMLSVMGAMFGLMNNDYFKDFWCWNWILWQFYYGAEKFKYLGSDKDEKKMAVVWHIVRRCFAFCVWTDRRCLKL